MSKLKEWENVIQCIDCLEGMKQLPDGCVDLVVTDPPYNLGKDYGDTYNDKRPEGEYWKDYKAWFTEIFRVLANGRLYVSCIPGQMWTIKPLLEDIGFKYCQFLVWHARNCFLAGKASKKRIGQPWTMTFEVIFLFKKGKPQKMLNVPTELTFDVMIVSSPQRNFQDNIRLHTTQKPLKLFKNIVARTPGDLILDPFAGSGTTLVAAKQLNRRFIGFEINQKYVDIAKERLRQEVFDYDQPQQG